MNNPNRPGVPGGELPGRGPVDGSKKTPDRPKASKRSRLKRLFLVYLLSSGALANVAILVGLPVGFLAGPSAVAEFARARYAEVARFGEPAISRARRLYAVLDGRAWLLDAGPLPDAFPGSLATTESHPEPVDGRRVLRVGPDHEFTRPSEAAAAARAGDVIEIEAGLYSGDSTSWRANNLTIRGVGGLARLDAAGAKLFQDKAIWVISGDNVRIENIEFFNAKSRDRNGAGIRAEGARLFVRRCFFHDNESGILTARPPRGFEHSEIRVEQSEFARNGHANGLSHQIYVGPTRRFVFRFNYVHETFIGSSVKSRAETSIVSYNRIVDGAKGRGNYSIDISNGGRAYVVGNTIQQSPLTENPTLLTFAPEPKRHQKNELYLVNNTFVNDREYGFFIRNGSNVTAHAYNNLFVGPGRIARGEVILVGNVAEGGLRWWEDEQVVLSDGAPGSFANRRVKVAGIQGRRRFEYGLVAGAAATDSGHMLESTEEEALEILPRFEYVHPLSYRPRKIVGSAIDAGAFEADS